MLGEAALTAADAARYLRAYENAIDAIGRASGGRGIVDGPGISIKLSALHPRYQRAQIDASTASSIRSCWRWRCARAATTSASTSMPGVGAARALARPARDGSARAGARRLGRHRLRRPGVPEALPVRDRALVDLARRSKHRLMVRPRQGRVLGQRDQARPGRGPGRLPGLHEEGLHRPRLSACARRLLAASDAVFPQFATHNAHTLAAIHELAGADTFTPGQYEFQACTAWASRCTSRSSARPRTATGAALPHLRAGRHARDPARLPRAPPARERRQPSFVHRIADASVPLETLVEDPVRRSSASPRTKRRRASSVGRTRRSHCRARSMAQRDAIRVARSGERGSARAPRRCVAREPRAPLDRGAAARR